MRCGDLFGDFLVYYSPNPINLLRPGHEAGFAVASPLLVRVVHLGGDVLCIRTETRRVQRNGGVGNVQ